MTLNYAATIGDNSMPRNNRTINNRGSGMLLGFFSIMILFALGVSFLSLTATSVLTSKKDALRARALAAAEAGVDKAIALIMSSGPNNEGVGNWRTSHSSTDPDNHSGDTFYTGNLDSNTTYKICASNGSGVSANKIVVTSIGTATQDTTTTSRSIKVVLDVRKENVNVWNNAIFGGVGQAGKSINGNIKIRGSVHLLGDGEEYTDLDHDGHWDARETFTDKVPKNGAWDAGEVFVDSDNDGKWSDMEPFQDVNGNGICDPALTVTDLAEEMSGNADMGNNYNGMPAALRNLLPDLPHQTFGGESIDSLQAKLRVKHGKVNISGTASVGYTNVANDPNGEKETMDGVYVSDGFGGTAGASSVHADNGTSNGYDLGDGVVTLPLLTFDSYTKDGVTYSNYLDYLHQTSTVYTGDLYISKGAALSIVGPNGSLTVDAAGNMTITGKIYVTGNINFTKNGQINYTGKGTLTTPNSTYVHCNVLPKTKFPTTDALGLISAVNCELATGPGDSQLSMALTMYAQQKIISNKQNEVAGTMVTSYFQMSNVPRLYQVPALQDNLPPGMPGADPIYIISVSTISWQENKAY